ncbi:MAG TPA: thymidine phosphorylase [Solirubrobacteraceae bacterium]|nr:thymidine phosphorylase [Solirubrobacteraceae bacterium]
MLPQEIIRRKRDGIALRDAEIDDLIEGLTSGRITEGQVAAFAMAVFFNGMSRDETVALTRAMTASGVQLRWDDLDGPVLDKHSTGGIGDKVSLILAPTMAACGAYMPKISGRGLGHTGGTLDKLDTVPGYDTRPDVGRLQKVVDEVGCAIVGQTAEVAPADRRLYSIRDATGTVESLPLIVASILSKKLAAGLDALVMDVKFGSGAFMAAREDADELAAALVEVAGGAGLPTVALLTDMDEVLGTTAGNAVEVREAIDYLTGTRESRLHEVTIALAASLIEQGGLADDGRAAAEKALDSGAAAERFAAMIAALGGPSDFVERPDLATAPVTRAAHPERAGVITGMNCRAVGLVVTGLGGNRRREDDVIDPAVGLTEIAPVGAEVGPDRPLAIVHAADEAAADEAVRALNDAVTVGDEAPAERPVIAGRIA